MGTGRRGWRAGTATFGLVCVVLLAGCSSSASPQRTVVVGAGSTDEQSVLGELAVAALERAGLDAELRDDLGGTVDLRREAIQGSVDLFWGYTGATWVRGLHEESPPADPTESYERVRRADEDRGLVWLEPTDVNATLALFVDRADLPQDRDRATLSWVSSALSGGEGVLCADPDFVHRAGGLDALTDAYAINRDQLQVRARAEDEAIAGVAAGKCFAGLATATSGAARNAGLVPVKDDLVVFPAFVVAPVAREAAVQRLPGLADALAPLVGALDTATLASLNARVAAGADAGDVAEEFLAGMETEARGESGHPG